MPHSRGWNFNDVADARFNLQASRRINVFQAPRKSHFCRSIPVMPTSILKDSVGAFQEGSKGRKSCLVRSGNRTRTQILKSHISAIGRSYTEVSWLNYTVGREWRLVPCPPKASKARARRRGSHSVVENRIAFMLAASLSLR